MIGLFAWQEARRFAILHSGETVALHPYDPTIPVQRVRVVGHSYGAVLVEPTGPLPEALRKATRHPSEFPADAFLRVRLFPYDLLAVPPALLRPTGAYSKHYPGKCPRCSAPAYVGATPAAVDCSAGCKF